MAEGIDISAVGSIEPDPVRRNLVLGPAKPSRGSALKGKLAVVTGAAHGIGRAIAVEFAANGADVVVIDIASPVSPEAMAMVTGADYEVTGGDSAKSV